MINRKKLLKLARKQQNIAAMRRKRIISPRSEVTSTYPNSCSTTSEAEKGHFVVYSADQKRFLLPLEYLNSEVIRDLFHMAEDVFGLPSNGPLTLPCEAELLEYAITLIKQQVNRDVERALLTSIASNVCSLQFQQQYQLTSQHLAILGY